MQQVEARIDLAVPDRPIGPWSRRTRAPEGVRDRTGPDQPGATLGPHAIRRRRTTPVGSGQSAALFNAAIRPSPQALATAQQSLTRKRP